MQWNLNRILVILKPHEEKQVALEKALQLAQISNAKITVLSTLHDDAIDSIGMVDFELHKTLVKEKEHVCFEWMDKVLLHYGATQAVAEKLIHWDKNLFNAIEHIYDHHSNFDLVIKANSHSHDGIIQKFFSPLDWHIIRHSPCPVLLVKTGQPWVRKQSLVAMDATASDDADKHLNEDLLTIGMYFQKEFELKLNIVNAYPFFNLDLRLHADALSIEQIQEDVEKYHREAFMKYAKQFNLDDSVFYLEEGEPDIVIENVASQVGAELLIMGTRAREGFDNLLHGNTSERIIDEVNADVLIIRR